MKNIFIYLLFLSVVTGICVFFSEELSDIYYNFIYSLEKNKIVLTSNEYYKDKQFSFVQTTDDFVPHNSQDIINIFYTVINSGQDSFTFFCPKDYSNCTNDVKELASDQTKLSHINNFVHPYNGFKHIEIQYTSSGKVDINITKNYTQDEIDLINEKIDSVYDSIVSKQVSTIEKIRIAHDYIINGSKYDSARSDFNIIKYKSDIAYGPLFQGYGICGGYSDAMILFLDKMGVDNFKVSSSHHVWNVVYVNDGWYHLDLTWDDPITSDGSDILQDEFFLLTSDQIIEKGGTEHIFDKTIYSEL